MLSSNDKICFVKNGTRYYCENNMLKTGDGFGEESSLFWQEVFKQKPNQILIESNTDKQVVCSVFSEVDAEINTQLKTQNFSISVEQSANLNVLCQTLIETNNKIEVKTQHFVQTFSQSKSIEYFLTYNQPIENKTQINAQSFLKNLYDVGIGLQAVPNDYSIAIKLNNIFYVYYNNQWLETTESEFHSIGLDWAKLDEKECNQLTNKLFNYNGEIQIYCTNEYVKKTFKSLLIQYSKNKKPEIKNPQLIVGNYQTPIIVSAEVEDAEKQQLEHRLLVKRPPLRFFGNLLSNASESFSLVVGTAALFNNDFILKMMIPANTHPSFTFGVLNVSQYFVKLFFQKESIKVEFNDKTYSTPNDFLLKQDNYIYISYIAATKTFAVFLNNKKFKEFTINKELQNHQKQYTFFIRFEAVNIKTTEIYMYQNISSIEQINKKLADNDYSEMLLGYKPTTEQYEHLQINGKRIITERRSTRMSTLDEEIWEPITPWKNTASKFYSYTTFDIITKFGLDNNKITPITEWQVNNTPLKTDNNYGMLRYNTDGLLPNQQVWNVFADLAEPTQILLFKTSVFGVYDYEKVRINLYGSNNNIKWDLIAFYSGDTREGIRYALETVNTEPYRKLQLEFLFDTSSPLYFAEPLIFTTSKSGEIPLKLEVRDSQGATTEWITNVHYSNHSPIMAAEISNGKFNARVVDSDLDDTQTTLLLNEVERLTLPYNKTPYNITYTWHDNEVKLNENNTITAVLTDLNGNQTKQNFNFIAKPYGLYFIDEQENFYTSNDGKIKMQLNFDHIVGGHPSKIKPITLINHTQQAIENIRVWSEKWCWFSTGPDGLSETREYTIDSLQAGEKKTIYCFVLPPRTYQGEAVVHIFAEGR